MENTEGGQRDRRATGARPDEGPPTQAWRPGEKTEAWRPGSSRPSWRPADPAPTQRPAAAPPRAPDPPTQRITPPAREPVTPPAKAAPAQTATAPVQVRRLRRGRLAIRKVSPWAMFKFSLVFFFCMMLIVLLGTAIIFAMLKAFGVIADLEKLLRGDLGFDVTISGGMIFRWVFLLGLVGTVVMSAIAMFMSFLYNLIADVVGGIELLVTERE